MMIGSMRKLPCKRWLALVVAAARPTPRRVPFPSGPKYRCPPALGERRHRGLARRGIAVRLALWALRRQLVHQLGPQIFDYRAHFVRNEIDALVFEELLCSRSKSADVMT